MVCARCNTAYGKETAHLPRGWKRHAEQVWCDTCWRRTYVLRAVTIPISAPVDGDWPALREKLKLAWQESTTLANWAVARLAALYQRVRRGATAQPRALSRADSVDQRYSPGTWRDRRRRRCDRWRDRWRGAPVGRRYGRRTRGRTGRRIGRRMRGRPDWCYGRRMTDTRGRGSGGRRDRGRTSWRGRTGRCRSRRPALRRGRCVRRARLLIVKRRRPGRRASGYCGRTARGGSR